MRKLVGQKLRRLHDEAIYNENWDKYIQYLKKCNEDEIREAFGADDKSQLLCIVFMTYEDAFDYVSEDFIREMFINLTDDQKKQVEQNISEMIYHVGEDIYRDNKNTMKYYSKMANWLYKIRCYILYCNPIDESIKREYDFIMNEVFYYTYLKE